MATTSLMFIVYVNDAPAAARFYGDLLGIAPAFETPHFISFDLGPGADLALWSAHSDELSPEVQRTSEVCLTLDGGPDELEKTFEDWKSKGVTIVQPPYDAVFGRTFVAADPDGNKIRVAPQD